jgi:hypothetical protein
VHFRNFLSRRLRLFALSLAYSYWQFGNFSEASQVAQLNLRFVS